MFLQILNLAVGILFLAQIIFIKAFEPSNLEAYLLGPKTFTLFFFKKSTIPFTKGSSGPTTTKSILYNFINFKNFLKFSISTSIFVAN